MPRKRSKRAPVERTAVGTIEEHREESNAEPAVTIAGRGASVAYTLNPKVVKLSPNVTGPDGKAYTLRLDAGFVYHLPGGMIWGDRDGEGNRGLPASIIALGESKEAPVRLSDITPARVQAYRIGRRMPYMAGLRSYLVSKLGEGEAREIALLGETAVVEAYNTLAELDGREPAQPLGMLPPAPSGVTALSPKLAETLHAEFSPRTQITPQARAEQAFASEPLDAEADYAADERREQSRKDAEADEF